MSRSAARATIAALEDQRRSEDRVSADSLSLGRRLRQPKTIISLVLPILLLILFVRALPGIQAR